MAWLNCMDNPERDLYPCPCVYHGWMKVSKRVSFFTYEPVESRIPLAVPWNGTEDDLTEQLWAFLEDYCKQKGLQSTCTDRGGEGDYYGTAVLERVEEVRTAIPDVYLRAFRQ